MSNPRAFPIYEPFDLAVEQTAATRRLQDLLRHAMHEQDVNQAELARRMGISPPAVHQLLHDDERSPQVGSFVEAFYRLGYRLVLDVVGRP